LVEYCSQLISYLSPSVHFPHTQTSPPAPADQVKLLYGPLLACVTASKSAYDAMIRQHSPDGTHEGFARKCREEPGGAEAAAYRQWVGRVLQPLVRDRR
jgi:hypothetical protein